jgi:hypothetical protein
MHKRHRVIRSRGGSLVLPESRKELERSIDQQVAAGYALIHTFTVDDNVYLVFQSLEDVPDGTDAP